MLGGWRQGKTTPSIQQLQWPITQDGCHGKYSTYHYTCPTHYSPVLNPHLPKAADRLTDSKRTAEFYIDMYVWLWWSEQYARYSYFHVEGSRGWGWMVVQQLPLCQPKRTILLWCCKERRNWSDMGHFHWLLQLPHVHRDEDTLHLTHNTMCAH